MKKKNYESPEAETFVVRVERKFLLVSGQNEVFQQTGKKYTGGWTDEDEEGY